jgi:hypothetical protein
MKDIDVFFKLVSVGPLASSKVGGYGATLYGTVYWYLTQYYLGNEINISSEVQDFLIKAQANVNGLLVGPELTNFNSLPNALHDIEHLMLHSTATTLPFCQQFGITIKKLVGAHKFLEIDYLREWLSRRSWKQAWFEGNNLLFIGQLLVYMRDVEGESRAQTALEEWFRWLDEEIDPLTSLWGTQGFCGTADAVYGGYHQLLLYWHEDHPIPNPEGLVDTVLSLRHDDGGFNPRGNGGACEDVDSVDILVNCYKRWDYRRAEIRRALWHCVDHILATQNHDGGFPYNRNQPQSHMGIPGTEAEPNVSCTFPTWFRIHTLALCHEIIPEHPRLAGIPFRFNSYLSMGWHKSPEGWTLKVPDGQLMEERSIEKKFTSQKRKAQLMNKAKKVKRMVYRLKGLLLNQ